MKRLTVITALLLIGPVADRLFANQPVLIVPSEPVPMSLTVDVPGGAALQPGDSAELVELGGDEARVPAHVLPGVAADGTVGDRPRLAAVIPAGRRDGDHRRFRLSSPESAPEPAFTFSAVDDKTLRLDEGGERVLAYNLGVIVREDLPKSEHRRSRSCYIHPVWGLHGEVLTDDFPKDHYHHHGVFWTWPYIDLTDDDRGPYDSWQGSKIHQRFHQWLARSAGDVAGLIAVENRWIAEADEPRHVMTERVWMQAYPAVGGGRAIDIRLVLNPTDSPVMLWGRGGKSYGGLTVRFVGRPNKDQVITVPDGRIERDLKVTRLPWADFTRHFKDAPHRSGGTVMIHPEHPDYPPTWLVRHYGPQCVGWPGVEKHTIEPGKPVTLRYRLWVHADELTPEQLRQAYAGYAASTEAKWEEAE